jgi:dihydroneopterin aldolase
VSTQRSASSGNVFWWTLNRTISYSEVAKRVRAIVEGEARALLEAVVEAVAADLLAAYPRAAAVTVTMRKPEAPVKGAFFDAVGVRIRRTRKDAP